jgi:hypothetical protein
VRDIDRIISLVREQLPDVEVTQHRQTHPGDDDGLWFIWQPGIDGQIQLESTSGMCPFLVEVDAQAWHAGTTREAVQGVIKYLVGRLSQ